MIETAIDNASEVYPQKSATPPLPTLFQIISATVPADFLQHILATSPQQCPGHSTTCQMCRFCVTDMVHAAASSVCRPTHRTGAAVLQIRMQLPTLLVLSDSPHLRCHPDIDCLFRLRLRSAIQKPSSLVPTMF